MSEEQLPEKDETFLQEIKSGIQNLYDKAVNWMKLDKDQSKLVQVLVFILKLPLLLLLLLLSPVLLVILLFVFIAAF
jgi:hypothetical protein